MENKLKKKYGLPMAIAMVIGIVIGSGVFFKAEAVLKATGGDLSLGILAWIIGGLIMMACVSSFSVMASKYEYVNGIVDYADVTLGKKFGYYVGWFMATIYYPTLASVLSWVSARYLCVLIGFDITGPECMVISGLFLISAYVLNSLAPKLSEKVQVSTLVIKLIPILLMAIIGTIYGLMTGMTVENFKVVSNTALSGNSGLFGAIVSTAFAYEGWIIATSINAELRDAKKNMPIALTIGGIAIILIYTLYYIGVAGVVPNNVMMESGQAGAKLAYSTIFGNIGGTILFVFVIISCLGTLNGIVVGGVRGFYSVAARNLGPKPNVLKQVDVETNIPQSSAILSLLMSSLWLVYFYGANLTESWFGPVVFDSSELPIVASYAIYLPILFMFMVKEKGETKIRRFILPILACIGCVFMVIAAIYAHRWAVSWFLLVFVVFMIVGAFFSKERK